MRRELRIVLLTAGVVLGFGSGVRTLQHRAWEHRFAWERHLAAMCVEAGRRGDLPPRADDVPPLHPGERW